MAEGEEVKVNEKEVINFSALGKNEPASSSREKKEGATQTFFSIDASHKMATTAHHEDVRS